MIFRQGLPLSYHHLNFEWLILIADLFKIFVTECLFVKTHLLVEISYEIEAAFLTTNFTNSKSSFTLIDLLIFKNL